MEHAAVSSIEITHQSMSTKVLWRNIALVMATKIVILSHCLDQLVCVISRDRVSLC